MKSGKLIFVAMLILTAAASAFAQAGPGVFSNVTTPQLTVQPQNPVPQVTSASAAASVQGSTAYFYWIVTNSAGTYSLPAGPFVVPNGPASLSSTVFNTITFTPLAGGYSYDILRTTSSVSPTGACNCAVAIGTLAGVIKDTSNSLQNYTVTITQQNCTLTNAIPSGQSTQALVSNCTISAGQTSENINIKDAPYNAKGNTQVSENGGQEAGGSGVCPVTSNVCLYVTTGPFTQADVGKTLWQMEPATGIIRATPSPIAHVYNSTTVDTIWSISETNGPKPGEETVWGTDDTASITAATSVATSTGQTIFIPCGNFMVTGPALVQSTTPFAGTYSIVGENEGCAQIIPSPTISVSGTGNTGGVINFSATSKEIGNFTVNLLNTNLAVIGDAGMSVTNFQGRWQKIFNMQVVGGSIEAGGAINLFQDQNSTIDNFSGLNPNGAENNDSGDECRFVGSASNTFINGLCSNAAGADSVDLRVLNSTPAADGFALTVIGSIIDECGSVTTGGDGANSACTFIQNSKHVSFRNSIMWAGGSNPNGGAAVFVDGTSDVEISGSDLGPFNTECSESASTLLIASGGIVRINNSTVRADGSCTTVHAVTNNGTLYWASGNTLGLSNGAGSFAGSSTPVYTTTQIGSVTTGHTAIWSNQTGGLADGGVSQTILAEYKVTLGSNVSLSSGSFATVVSQAITMPASCPCHVWVMWSAYGSGGGSTANFAAGVEDGTNNSTHVLLAPAGYSSAGNTGGFSATEWSGGAGYTYSGSVTFTLVATSSASSGSSIQAAPIATPSGYVSSPTYLEILVTP